MQDVMLAVHASEGEWLASCTHTPMYYFYMLVSYFSINFISYTLIKYDKLVILGKIASV